MSNRPKRQVPSSAKVSAARQSGGGSTPVWVWIVGAAVVVVAAVIAVLITSGDDDTVTTADGEQVEALVFGEPSVDGAPLAELTGGVDGAVGSAIPTVSGQTLAGDIETIEGGDGTGKIVMFLAHWCPHCQAEVPRLTQWLEENGAPEGVELYAVATATDETRPNFPPGEWLQEEGWPVTTLVDDRDGTIAQAYGLSGFPYFVAVGPDGNVVARASGELSIEQWEQLVAAAQGSSDAVSVDGGPASPR